MPHRAKTKYGACHKCEPRGLGWGAAGAVWGEGSPRSARTKTQGGAAQGRKAARRPQSARNARTMYGKRSAEGRAGGAGRERARPRRARVLRRGGDTQPQADKGQQAEVHTETPSASPRTLWAACDSAAMNSDSAHVRCAVRQDVNAPQAQIQGMRARVRRARPHCPSDVQYEGSSLSKLVCPSENTMQVLLMCPSSTRAEK